MQKIAMSKMTLFGQLVMSYSELNSQLLVHPLLALQINSHRSSVFSL